MIATIAVSAWACGAPPKLAAVPSASHAAAAGSAVRLSGINVEPSYRPWRYLAGPNPDGWWCVQPNCTQNPDPTVTINAELALANSLGVGNLRLEFPWTFIEPTTKGTYDWSRADTIVSAAQSHGVQLQPIIVFTPLWSRSDPTLAPAPQDFYDFVHALVSRYKSSIHIWEMWNEPDLTNYWNSGEQAYVTSILVPGFNAVRAADPSAKVVIGAPSQANSSWLNSIYTMGGGNSFDIMAYHDYGPYPLADGSTVQSVLDAHGQGSKPIWLGEYGLQENAIADVNQQALMTATLTQSGSVALAQWYNLRDDYTMGCCPPSIIKSQYFGLVLRDDATQKDGYATMQGLIGTPPPALSVSAAQASGGGFSINFTGTATGGSSPYWYYWDFGDGGSSTQLSPSHTYPGAGSYLATFTVVDAVGRGSSSTVVVNVGGAPAGAAVLPAEANAAYGGYTTVTQVQNVGTAPATVSILYFDSNGAPVGSGDSIASLPVNATWSVRQDNGNSFAPGSAGSARVSATQPVATFVNEFAPGSSSDATSYTGISPGTGTGAVLFAPVIGNNAYGGYTTGIGLLNLASTTTDLTITYRDGTGSPVKVQTLSAVAAGAYQALYSGDPGLGLPVGFAGTATIASSAGNLAAIVNETGPGGQFSSYDAVPAGSTTLYAPAALNNAYGGFNTGMGIQNTTGSAGTVTITYYDVLGSPTVKTFSIVANGYLGVYQGTDIPATGAYTAKITSTVAIAAIVNEVASSPNPAVQQSTAYNTFAAGSSSLHLPLVESAGADGWSTGEGIMNTGTAATTVTVTYYDPVSGAQVGSAQSSSLQPNAFWGLYQPTGGLPIGARASAVVTTTSGGQVAVICNESNASTLMSYSAQ